MGPLRAIFFYKPQAGLSPIIRVAEKLGFKEIARKKAYREVKGEKYDALTFRLDL